MKKRTKSEVGRFSHSKGGRGERAVCKLLGNFFYNDPKSFARYGNEGGGRISGDIGPCIKDDMQATMELLRLFPFCIEIKNREEWDFYSLLGNPLKSHLVGYWEQTIKQASRFKKCPLLLFTKNYKPWYVILDSTILPDLKGHTYGTNYLDFFEIPPASFSLIVKTPCVSPDHKRAYTLSIFTLDAFIKSNNLNRMVVRMRKKYKQIIGKDK